MAYPREGREQPQPPPGTLRREKKTAYRPVDQVQILETIKVLRSLAEELHRPELANPQPSLETIDQFDTEVEWLKITIRQFSFSEFFLFLEHLTRHKQVNSNIPIELISFYMDKRETDAFDLEVYGFSMDASDDARLFYAVQSFPIPEQLTKEMSVEDRTAFLKTVMKLREILFLIGLQKKGVGYEYRDDYASDEQLGDLQLRRENGIVELIGVIRARLEAGDLESYKRIFRLLKFWESPDLRQKLIQDILGLDMVQDTYSENWERKMDLVLRNLWA
jgi:hypothetical protein